MRLTAALLAVFFLATLHAGAQSTPAPQPKKRGWFGRILHPFSSTELPKYNDAKLRGLALDLELTPQPLRLSETRQLGVRVTLTNLSKRPVTLNFPSEQRIEIYLLSSTERVLTKWSDNHAFEENASSVIINPQERIEYNETISTRDLTPNTVFIAQAFFPRYPDLQMQKKFLTAP